MRPKFLAKDHSSEWHAWQHAIKAVKKKYVLKNLFVYL